MAINVGFLQCTSCGRPPILDYKQNCLFSTWCTLNIYIITLNGVPDDSWKIGVLRPRLEGGGGAADSGVLQTGNSFQLVGLNGDIESSNSSQSRPKATRCNKHYGKKHGGLVTYYIAIKLLPWLATRSGRVATLWSNCSADGLDRF